MAGGFVCFCGRSWLTVRDPRRCPRCGVDGHGYADFVWLRGTVSQLTGIDPTLRPSQMMPGVYVDACGLFDCYVDDKTIAARDVSRLRWDLQSVGWPLLEDQTLGDGAVGSTREDELARKVAFADPATEERPLTTAPSRPVCSCGQEVSRNSGFGSDVCVDCSAMRYKNIEADDRPLDDRIAAVQPKRDDEHGGAWATATAEGES